MLYQEINLSSTGGRADNVEVIDKKCDSCVQFRHSGNDLGQYGSQYVVASRGNETCNVARDDAAYAV